MSHATLHNTAPATGLIVVLFCTQLALADPAGNWPGIPEDHMELNQLCRVTPKTDKTVLYVALSTKTETDRNRGDEYVGIDHLRLIAEDNQQVLQEIPGLNHLHAEDAQIGDFNFDGYKDVRACNRNTSGNGFVRFEHFLFNPRTKRYEGSQELDALPFPHFDHQQKEVLAFSKGGSGHSTDSRYHWQEGKLVLISSVDRDRDTKGWYVETTLRLPSGELKRSREYDRPEK